MSLRKQGATPGATTAFLISTPESGVDSIAVTYAMMDPVMTAARPVSAFITALTAGVIENLFSYRKGDATIVPDLTCPVDGCCDGVNCDPSVHRRHHGFGEKLRAGIRFAVIDLWGDIAGWFLAGVLLAGLITVLIPDDLFGRYLGSGLPAMLLMLAVGVPLYICASASTPIAAALILKGVSPGAALVFLLAGPATNMAALDRAAGGDGPARDRGLPGLYRRLRCAHGPGGRRGLRRSGHFGPGLRGPGRRSFSGRGPVDRGAGGRGHIDQARGAFARGLGPPPCGGGPAGPAAEDQASAPARTLRGHLRLRQGAGRGPGCQDGVRRRRPWPQKR